MWNQFVNKVARDLMGKSPKLILTIGLCTRRACSCATIPCPFKNLRIGLGCESATYFVRTFKKEMEMTPLEYRKEKSNSHEKWHSHFFYFMAICYCRSNFATEKIKEMETKDKWYKSDAERQLAKEVVWNDFVESHTRLSQKEWGLQALLRFHKGWREWHWHECHKENGFIRFTIKTE